MNIVLDCQVCVCGEESSCRGPGSRLAGAHLSAGSGKGSKCPELGSNRPQNHRQPSQTHIHTHACIPYVTCIHTSNTQRPCHFLLFCLSSSLSSIFGLQYNFSSIQQALLEHEQYYNRIQEEKAKGVQFTETI